MNRVMNELPSYYRGIKEFQELTRAQSNRLDHLDGAIQQFEDDQFILTSSEPAIYRREKEFNILPDRKKETLDFRKKRLLSRMMQKAPFTFRYMVQQLDELIGKNLYTISIDVANYWLEVLVTVESQSYYKEAADMLERTVPLNLILETGILAGGTIFKVVRAVYSFPVFYPVTGTFHTAAIYGRGVNRKLTVKKDAYGFKVKYPVTGTFYAGEGL